MEEMFTHSKGRILLPQRCLDTAQVKGSVNGKRPIKTVINVFFFNFLVSIFSLIIKTRFCF